MRTGKERRKMSELIETTLRLMQEEDISNLSVRKITKSLGITQGVIYYHFKDIKRLLCYVGILYLREISLRFNHINLESEEESLLAYEKFNEEIFNRKDLFFNLYYGIYRNDILEITKDFYDIYKFELKQEEIDIIEKVGIGKEKYFLKNILTNKSDYLILDKLRESYLYDTTIGIENSRENYFKEIKNIIARLR